MDATLTAERAFGVEGSDVTSLRQRFFRSRRKRLPIGVPRVASRPAASTSRDMLVVGPGGAPSRRSFHDSAHVGAMTVRTTGIVNARASAVTRVGEPLIAAWCKGEATSANRPGPSARSCR